MVKVIATLGERLLGAVVPQNTAEANDYCEWNYRCRGCFLGAKFQRQLCCTSQDGSYCNPWETYIDCARLVIC